MPGPSVAVLLLQKNAHGFPPSLGWDEEADMNRATAAKHPPLPDTVAALLPVRTALHAAQPFITFKEDEGCGCHIYMCSMVPGMSRGGGPD